MRILETIFHINIVILGLYITWQGIKPEPETIHAFTHAAATGDIGSVASRLHSRPQYLNRRDFLGHTGVSKAAENNHKEVVEFLLKEGADPNIESRRTGETALLMAARNGHWDLVEYLLDNGASANVTDRQRRSLVYWAAHNPGGDEILKRIVGDVPKEHLSRCTKEGVTPLSLSVCKKRKSTTKILLDAGAEANVECPEKTSSPLHCASSHGNVDLAKYLLDHGANPTELDSHDNSAAFVALRSGKAHKLLTLMKESEMGKKKMTKRWLNDFHPNGESFLRVAAFFGQKELVELLLSWGMDADAYDRHGTTPLASALYNAHSDIGDLLLKAGADVNKKDFKGNPPLVYAYAGGHASSIEYLENHGAEDVPRDVNGEVVILSLPKWAKAKLDNPFTISNIASN